MYLLLFIVAHWYVSLFFQSIFHHRYAAHGHFKTSKAMERFFHIGCWVSQGSSYISAYAYGIMHRIHHAHTDVEGDPHSPQNNSNLFTMMWNTRSYYYRIYSNQVEIDPKYTKGVPAWPAFDKFAHNWVVRLMWMVLYLFIYTQLVTAPWQYIFLPFTCLISSFQGAVINWWAHKFGYENHELKNTSKNIIPFDIFFWGEGYHNNHHKYPARLNNANKWFEWDMGYLSMRVMQKLGLIKLVQPQVALSPIVDHPSGEHPTTA